MDGHEHEIGKQRPRADVSRPHERAFARYSGMAHRESPTSPSLHQLSIRPPTPYPHPTPSDPDRLKWFVFDLTTTAATAATATVDGGTLFPPRTLPSFNVSRRMCGGVALPARYVHIYIYL